ncbi:MAG: peptidoglycan editing factor PgeF [Ahrensia sp.]|nr:peptidoglycan editing factor PgeF [Ahrensia sp.]
MLLAMPGGSDTVCVNPKVRETMSQLQPITAEPLNALSGIRHAFFTRPGGVSSGIYAGLNAGLGSGDQREDVIENRNRMADWIGCEHDSIASPYQVHSPDCVITRSAWQDNRPKADGVATDKQWLVMGIVTADCGPVLFADAQARVVAACHAGWGGALKGVLDDTIAKMETLGAKRANIVAVLGPTISQTNYEVGPTYPDPFLTDDSGNSRFFIASKRDGHFMFDLPGYIINRLEGLGVSASWTGHCTYADEALFFSYRRTTHRGEPDYGRQMSAIMLSED